MKNIHVLPTNKPSRLLYNFRLESFCIQKEKDEMYINDGKVSGADFWSIEKANNNGFRYVNIYITSDEEIKEGDWFYLDDAEIIAKYIDLKPVKEAKKIILTTDQDLIKDGVQAIDDEFLEWFIKNPNCEFADVNDWMSTNGSIAFDADKRYQICNHIYPKTIIPQEEPKQEIVGYRLKPFIDRMMVDGILKNAMPIWNDEDKSVYFIRGHVAGSLVAKMKELQVLDLWFIPIYEDEEIKSDWVKENHLEYYYKEGIMKEEHKQETLEEAAEREYPKEGEDSIYCDLGLIQQGAFIEGAKWQAKRMYSEEEVLDLLAGFIDSSRGKDFVPFKTIQEYFEQFKNR